MNNSEPPPIRAGLTRSAVRGSTYGTPDAVAVRLNEHIEAGADHVAVQVLAGSDKLVPALAELAGPLGVEPA